jgi:protein tyrosine phosphatase
MKMNKSTITTTTANKSLELLKSILKDSTRFKQYALQKFAQVNENEEVRSIEPLYQQLTARHNEQLNRYSNIVPYDSNCTKLTDTRFGLHGDYINASWILAPYDIPKFYIATQGPISTTLYDFWRLVVEKHVSIIVCLTPEIEKNVLKCGRYWPLENEALCLTRPDSGHYVIVKNIKKSRNDMDANCIVRTISIEMYNGQEELLETRQVTQLQFLGWPDHGAPTETNHVIALIKLTRQFEQENKPVLVHCSAGCGRTGTFCVVDTAEYLVRTKPDLLIDPIFLLTDAFRKQRTTMVQAQSQYNFCYKALKDFMDQ